MTVLARIVSIIPIILLFPSGIGWILNPAETDADFGFIFNELNNHALYSLT